MHFNDKNVHFKDIVSIILPIFNSTTTIIGLFTNLGLWIVISSL